MTIHADKNAIDATCALAFSSITLFLNQPQWDCPCGTAAVGLPQWNCRSGTAAKRSTGKTTPNHEEKSIV
jgi:hypothetical protein